MRSLFFKLLLLTVCISSCKKEKIEIEAEKKLLPEDNMINAPACTGNTWTFDSLYLGNSNFNNSHIYTTPIVYNNKVYAFDKRDSIFFYDGTSWGIIPSQVPLPGRPSFGFVIGNKAYLGYDSEPDDFYYSKFLFEYNFATNAWASKAVFPGSNRYGASYFTIGNKGYVAGGFRESAPFWGNLNDTWEYNPATNIWTQKADLPSGRDGGTGFSIDNKGYIVTGALKLQSGNYIHYNSLLEYTPSTDSWAYKAPFPGAARFHPSVFVISGVAYAGGGRNNSTYYLNDFYKYNPATNSWSQIANNPPILFPSVTPYITVQGFSINSRGYVIYRKPNWKNAMIKYKPISCSYPNSSQ